MTDFSATGKPISATGGYDEARHGGGTSSFWLDGRLHRTDGPALSVPGRDPEWHVSGRRVDGSPAPCPDGELVFRADGVLLA